MSETAPSLDASTPAKSDSGQSDWNITNHEIDMSCCNNPGGCDSGDAPTPPNTPTQNTTPPNSSSTVPPELLTNPFEVILPSTPPTPASPASPPISDNPPTPNEYQKIVDDNFNRSDSQEESRLKGTVLMLAKEIRIAHLRIIGLLEEKTTLLQQLEIASEPEEKLPVMAAIYSSIGVGLGITAGFWLGKRR